MNNKIAPQLRDMTAADVDAVANIEQQVHSHPWTRGMFIDALTHGNLCKLYVTGSEIVGYAILLPALDEAQLLDISIARSHQRQGWGEKLLNAVLMLSKNEKFSRMILEVRRSNLTACSLYRKTGFAEIGVRRAYYPTENGREDAIVMEYKLQ